MVLKDDKPLPRRGFFLAGVRRFAEAAAETVENARKSLAEGRGRGARPRPSAWTVHPPGALESRAFLESCTKCDDCLRACPAWSIRRAREDEADPGYPVLEPGVRPCAMCADPLPCAAACEAGALRPVSRGSLDLGLARLEADRCLVIRGEACRLCVSWCPAGEEAIYMTGAGPMIVEAGCTGCGVCVAACPAGAISLLGRAGVLRD